VDRDIVRILVAERDVAFAVAVEVAEHNRQRTGGEGNRVGGGRKRTVAVAEKNGEGVVASVRNGQIVLAVAVEITDGKRVRL